MPTNFLNLTIPSNLDELEDRHLSDGGDFFRPHVKRHFGSRGLAFYPLEKPIQNDEDRQLIGFYAETRVSGDGLRVGTVRPIFFYRYTRPDDQEEKATVSVGMSVGGDLSDARAAKKLAQRLRDEANASGAIPAYPQSV